MRTTRRSIATIGLLVVTAGLATVVLSAPSQDDEAQKQSAEKRFAETAKRTYLQARQDMKKGHIREPEVLYRWSRRWMEHEQAASNTDKVRVDAARDHLQRMKDVEQLLSRARPPVVGAPYSYRSMVKYYRLKAESQLSSLE